MNLKKRFSQKENQFFIQDPSISIRIFNVLYSDIPKTGRDIVVLCVGTDRSTGDSLGPITGTLLQDENIKNLTIYGTLDEPVHAVNLEEKIEEINSNHINPFIIAIDACLGKTKSIGSIITNNGPLKPGAALKKELPEVGDYHISGVVNIGGYMEYLVLQNTRLHVVMQMAKKITSAITHLDEQLSVQQQNIKNTLFS